MATQKTIFYACAQAYDVQHNKWPFELYATPQRFMHRPELFKGNEYDLVIYRAFGSRLPEYLLFTLSAIFRAIEAEYGLMYHKRGISDGLDKPGEKPFYEGNDWHFMEIQ